MTLRDRTLVALLWLSVIVQSTWVGGTLYQMLVIVPMWSTSPPESVYAFFEGTPYNQLIWNFFGPPLMAARMLPVVAALVAGWHRPRHRTALLVAIVCRAFAVIFTLVYIYPINAVLFEQAGRGLTPDEIHTMVGQWVMADRIRFAIGVIGFVAILWAFRQPVTSDDARPN